jgi:Zn-finger protein
MCIVSNVRGFKCEVEDVYCKQCAWIKMQNEREIIQEKIRVSSKTKMEQMLRNTNSVFWPRSYGVALRTQK